MSTVSVSYREPLLRVDLNHALEQRLAVWGDEVGHVEHPTLHLLQELAQIVVVKRQGTLQEKRREGSRRKEGRTDVIKISLTGGI